MSDRLLTIQGLSKSYLSGSTRLHVLRDLDLDLGHTEFLAVVGRSGSGKTTLLNLIAGLDRPDTGHIFLQGKDLCGVSGHHWDRVRQTQIGVIFQFNQLLPEFSAQENVMMPGLISGMDDQEAAARAQDLLRRVGLEERTHHRPAQLSGGEQQRVAIARALLHSPKLVLADEPTGNLDAQSSQRIFLLMRELQAEKGVSFMLVTHNQELAHRCDRIISLNVADPFPPREADAGSEGYV